MNRVIAVVEGQTERSFVGEVLAPWLGSKRVQLTARLVGKPGRKGGVGKYERARKDILALLKQESATTITTMIDYYGMPNSWPGRTKAKGLPHEAKAATIEKAIQEDVANALGESFDRRRLIPYVQMHEFEALLFSEPTALSRVMRNPKAEKDLQAIRDDFDTPEKIDDDPNTAPSKRIERLFPFYRKPLHGVLAAQRISVDAMRQECPHFNQWLASLEHLGSQ